ncbi:MAG TPA: hypothetical protein VD763_11915 [Candidatus Saccharimonadales bacterium]|nr:hypothetical protein [Candidatus Saccharimonadales bacterium]
MTLGMCRLAGRCAALVLLLAQFGSGSAGAVAAAEFDAAAAAPSSAPSAADWDGSIDLYRRGAFTTQKTWQWCTAAGVQIVRNLVERDDDHSRRSQARYNAWMRDHNRYDLPASAGVDPTGWTAGLRHFVDDRYRLVASRSFGAAVRSAVTNLRRTNLPVALTVAHGGHGWILTGFSATADPLVTDDFEVTTVRVVGPLYGRQSRDGYDMPPNTELTVRALRRFLTAWRYEPLPMVWDGRFVTIQPVAEEPVEAVPPARPVSGPLWLVASARSSGHR